MRAGRSRGELERVGPVVVVTHRHERPVAPGLVAGADALQLGRQRVAAAGARVAVVVDGGDSDGGMQVCWDRLTTQCCPSRHTQCRECLADCHLNTQSNRWRISSLRNIPCIPT